MWELVDDAHWDSFGLNHMSQQNFPTLKMLILIIFVVSPNPIWVKNINWETSTLTLYNNGFQSVASLRISLLRILVNYWLEEEEPNDA